MKRAILDTNIYGKIIREEETNFVVERAGKSGFVIYGCDAIRKELRKTAKDKTIYYSGKIEKIRLLLLRLYRLLVKPDHEIEITKEMEDVVYSDDNRTMLCAEAKIAYNTVNSIRGEKTPNFKSYGEFKNDIS